MEYVTEYKARKRSVLRTLAYWGGANVVGGAAMGVLSTGDDARNLGWMSAGWGAINGALGLVGLRTLGSSPDTPDWTAKDQVRTSKILLFNAGLDVGYVVAGAYLLERARSELPGQRQRLRGFGYSVIAQGAALFAFDLLSYRSLQRTKISIRPVTLPEGGGGIGASVTF